MAQEFVPGNRFLNSLSCHDLCAALIAGNWGNESVAIFSEHGICGRQFAAIAEEDLISLGVTIRIKRLDAIYLRNRWMVHGVPQIGIIPRTLLLSPAFLVPILSAVFYCARGAVSIFVEIVLFLGFDEAAAVLSKFSAVVFGNWDYQGSVQASTVLLDTTLPSTHDANSFDKTMSLFRTPLKERDERDCFIEELSDTILNSPIALIVTPDDYPRGFRGEQDSTLIYAHPEDYKISKFAIKPDLFFYKPGFRVRLFLRISCELSEGYFFSATFMLDSGCCPGINASSRLYELLRPRLVNSEADRYLRATVAGNSVKIIVKQNLPESSANVMGLPMFFIMGLSFKQQMSSRFHFDSSNVAHDVGKHCLTVL